MLYFRDVAVQIAPRAKIHLTNPLDQSDFGLSLDLDVSGRVSCSIQCYEHGLEPMGSYQVELDDGHCGMAEIDDARTYCDIILFVTAEQFDLFLKAVNAISSRLQYVGVFLLLNPDFKALRNRRVYRIEQNPHIAMSTAEAK